MKRYIALLRGINVSGKNKISMPALKQSFEELDFSDVTTYINSGNVIFSSGMDKEDNLSHQIESMIKEQFHLDIAVFIILQENLEDILNHAPDWWGNENKEIYDNLIFIMPTYSYDELYNEIGGPKEEYEKVQRYNEVVFWSFVRKDYQKTNWWSKTAKKGVSAKLTIRTANTVRKIAGM